MLPRACKQLYYRIVESKLIIYMYMKLLHVYNDIAPVSLKTVCAQFAEASQNSFSSLSTICIHIMYTLTSAIRN